MRAILERSVGVHAVVTSLDRERIVAEVVVGEEGVVDILGHVDFETANLLQQLSEAIEIDAHVVVHGLVEKGGYRILGQGWSPAWILVEVANRVGAIDAGLTEARDRDPQISGHGEQPHIARARFHRQQDHGVAAEVPLLTRSLIDAQQQDVDPAFLVQDRIECGQGVGELGDVASSSRRVYLRAGSIDPALRLIASRRGADALK